MNILAIAYEPWETEVLLEVLSRFKADYYSGILNVRIFIADPYQISNHKPFERLNNNLRKYEIEFYTIQECYIKWQKTSKKDLTVEEIESEILDWSIKNKVEISTRRLALTDPILNPLERDGYYTKLTNIEKKKIFLDLCLNASKTLDEYKPNLVVSICVNYLVKALFSSLSSARGIRFETLVFSRWKKYWYFYTGFPGVELNPGNWLSKQVTAFGISQDVTNDSLGEIENSPLYRGETDKYITRLASGHLGDIIVMLCEYIRDLNHTIRIWSNPIKHIRLRLKSKYNSSFMGSSIWGAKRLVRRLGFIIYGVPYSKQSIPLDGFFYYPLHVQPESSVLTLGGGASDIEAIEYIARRLPYGMCLVVKENPLMISDRSYNYYRKISKIDGVILVGPEFDSLELIKRSKGVISLSGTALLEASVRDVPAYCMGLPEFSGLFNEHNWNRVEQFMVSSSMGKEKSKKNIVMDYFGWIKKNGTEIDLGWESLNSSERLSEVGFKIFKMLKRKLH